MSDNENIYKIEAGDTLTSISQKTNIPLNTLWNMKSSTLMDINALNPGDQIVFNNDIATYENQLYDQLTQPTPKQSNQAPTTASTNDQQDSYAPTNNSNPNPDCPTGTCKESVEKCLIEIEIETKGANNESERYLKENAKKVEKFGLNFYLPGEAKDTSTFFWKKANEKRIPDRVVYVAQQSQNTKDDFTFKYVIEGECQYEHNECIKVLLTEYIKLNDKYASASSKEFTGTAKYDQPAAEVPVALNERVSIEKKVGEIKHLNFDKDKEIYGSIVGDVVTPMHPKDGKDSQNIFEIIVEYASKQLTVQALKIAWTYGVQFIILSRLDKFPMNLRYLDIYECVTGSYVEVRKRIEIVSLPPYSHTLNGELSFDFEHKLNFKGKYELVYNDAKLTIEKEFEDLAENFPWLDKIARVLKIVTVTKKFGSTGLIPMSANIHPPKIVAEDITAALQSSHYGKIIKRSGSFACKPLIGFSLAIDIWDMLATQLKLYGATNAGATTLVGFGMDAMNLFDEVSATVDRDDRLKALRGKPAWFKGRLAGYLYLGFGANFGGSIRFKDSELFDDKDVCWDVFLTAEAKVELNGGMWGEVRIAGFGAGGGGLIESIISFHGKYYFRIGELIGWFGGIKITLVGEFSLGYQSQNKNNSTEITLEATEQLGGGDKVTHKIQGSKDSVEGSSTREKEFEVAPAGSETNPMFTIIFDKEDGTPVDPEARKNHVSFDEAMISASGMG